MKKQAINIILDKYKERLTSEDAPDECDFVDAAETIIMLSEELLKYAEE